MTDSEDQATLTAAPPVSDLTRRLLRRGTAPVGVIDMRRAEELHARSSQWPRLELLNKLRRRYGSGEQAGGAAGALPVAGGGPSAPPFQRMSTTPFGLTSVSTFATGTAMTETAMGTVSNTPATPPASQYRVRRPNRHAEVNSTNALPAETAATPTSAVSEIGTGTKPAATTQLLRKAREMPSADGGRPEPSALALARAADPRRANEEPGEDGPSAVGALPQVSELPRSTVAAPMPLQRMADIFASADMGRAGTQDDLSGGDAPTSTGPTPAGLPPSANQIGANTDSTVATEHPNDEPGHDGPRAAALPQVSELPRSTVATPMTLQRMPDGSVAAEIGRGSTQNDSSSGDLPEPGSTSSIEPPSATNDIRAGTNSASARRADDEARHNRSPATGALPHVSELPRSAVAAPMTLQRMPDGSVGAEISRAPAQNGIPAAADVFTFSPLAIAPYLEPSADYPPMVPAASSGPTAETTAAPPHGSAPAQFRGAVSPEIRTAPLQQGAASIVWRKSDTSGAGRGNGAASPAAATGSPYLNGAPIMRAPAPDPSSSPIEAAIPMPASEGNGVDVFLIAEQVSRIITRQLRVERERRGLRR